jgi:hypothetical protein
LKASSNSEASIDAPKLHPTTRLLNRSIQFAVYTSRWDTTRLRQPYVVRMVVMLLAQQRNVSALVG